MSRYIDAEWLKGQINTTFWAEIGKIIDNAPSIDIVRCKECRYCHSNYVDMTPPYAHYYCFKWSRYTNTDDYCSYGERREP